MKRVKTHKAYAIYVGQVVFLLLVIFLFIFSKGETGGFSCEEMRNGWTVLHENGTEETFDVLPEYVNTNDGNEIVIQRKIGTVEADNNTIGFFAFQQQVYVYLEKDEIMSFVPGEEAKSRTPGNAWKFIELKPEDGGKTLSIKIIQCYGKNKVTIPVLYQGTIDGIMASYLKEALPSFWISMLGVTIGIALVIMYIISDRKTLMLGPGLPWLGLFAIFIGIWSAIEGNTYSFFYDNLLLFSRISYLSLKMCIMPFIMFVDLTFHGGRSKVLKVLIGVSVAEFWITSILQFTGVVDFADTVLITHVIMMILAVLVTVNCVRDVIAERQNKTRRVERRMAYMTHSFLMIVIIVTSLTDMYRYYFTNSPDVAKFSRIGYLSYIITVIMALLLDFMKLVSIGKQAEHIKEEASMDAMTKLWNRACFEKDIDKPSPKKCKKMGIIVFDLNNLKTFNDNYGHEMGDYYIKVCSEVLRDSFSKWGNVYRIGGDEFCGIAKNLSEEEFERTKLEMESQIKQLRIPNYELTMGIASGFCNYDEKQDMSLRDTMKRADLNMYERKQRMKQETGEKK